MTEISDDEEIAGRTAFDRWRRAQHWAVTYDWADMSLNERRAWIRRAREEQGDD